MRTRLIRILLALCLAACTTVDEAPSTWDPPTWGQVAYLDEQGPPLVLSLDLEDGTQRRLFDAPDWSFVYELDHHADAGLAMAWSPPPAEEEDAYDRSLIGIVENGEVSALACDDLAGVKCFYPAFSADGASLWFVASGGPYDADAGLWRRDLATGEELPVVPSATEPAVSPVGGHITWIAVDPESGTRSLELGDESGSWTRTLIGPTEAYDLGQPVFSADGEAVIVAILDEPVASLWSALVPTAHAHFGHDAPGDWWRVPIDGGEPTRVTVGSSVHYDGAWAWEGGFVEASREGLIAWQGQQSAVLLELRSARALVWTE